MQRKAWRSQWQEDQLQQRAQNVLSTKESKESMRTSVKQSQEEASQNVTEQRAFLQEMATRRAELRADHAALGKELHSRHYGAEAGAKRSQMMATKHEERRQLGEKAVRYCVACLPTGISKPLEEKPEKEKQCTCVEDKVPCG